jgi:hypothetical protein
MNVGMLWFDNDPKSDLTMKIDRAAEYYRSKYGQTPNLCFVHPSMLDNVSPSQRQIEVRSNSSVRPNHFWLGIHKNGEKANA